MKMLAFYTHTANPNKRLHDLEVKSKSSYFHGASPHRMIFKGEQLHRLKKDEMN